MSFYLEKIIIYNNAPFEKLQLDFTQAGINVLTGLNGRGKTTIISFVVDANFLKKFSQTNTQTNQTSITGFRHQFIP